MTRRQTILCMSLSLCAAMLVAPTVAQATPIYTNFSGGSGYNTSNANPVGFDFFTGDNDAQGSSFLSGVNANVSSVRIALNSFNSSGGNTAPVTVSLRSNAAGLPGGILESWTIGIGAMGAFGLNNAPILLNSVVNPLLSSANRYWLTAVGSANDSVAWNLTLLNDLNLTATSVNGGGTWNNLGLTPGAFEVNTADITAVPEPGSLVLLASGMAVVSRRLRLLRRAKRTV
jgi:hypothetical protein